MPSSTIKPVLASTGDHTIQLFCTIYYNKYPAGTPPSVVSADPKQPYYVYTKYGFCNQYKTFSKNVNTLWTFGTGLKERFCIRFRLYQPPS
jgi:hypothetical protein